MSVSKRLRFEVLQRDGHRCRYCGKSAADSKLAVDHVIPVALGGEDTPEHLVTACVDCNAGDAMRWAAAMKRAAEIQRAQSRSVLELLDAVDRVWKNWKVNGKDEIWRPTDWPSTIRSFHSAGIGVPEMVDAIEIAMRASKVRADDIWRYFCGIVWNTLRKRQELALQLLNDETEDAPLLADEDDE